MVYQLITGATVVAFLSLFGLALESVGSWTLPAFIATGFRLRFRRQRNFAGARGPGRPPHPLRPRGGLSVAWAVLLFSDTEVTTYGLQTVATIGPQHTSA